METSLRTQIKVGVFAVLGVVLFCLSIVLLGGNKSFFTDTYDLKVRLPQVQGLGRGSVVTLTGVQVGNIDEINFIENSSDVEVTLKLQEAVQKRITEGSKASVKTQGALGDKFIYIEPGSPTNPPLKDGAILETDKTPDLIDMIASKGAELGEIVSVIKEVRLLFENINKDGRSAKLMSNLVESTDQFGKFMVEARETFRLMRTDAIEPMAGVMRKIDNGQGTLGALINDPSLHNRITSFFGDSPRNKFLKPLIRESIQTNESKK
ncbi:MAG: MCE family protein [Bdellovibrionales bacterium]|nr:MCE family protein [Bdellovibrionales bacterium]